VSFRLTSESIVLRRTAASVAILVLLFAGTVALLHHDDPGSSAVCQICYLIHLPVLGAQIRVQLPRPVETTETAPLLIQGRGADRIARHISPRAPPAE
jgi:hypothetical protein